MGSTAVGEGYAKRGAKFEAVRALVQDAPNGIKTIETVEETG